MDFLVVLALAVGFILCILPGVMAWSKYISSNRKSTEMEKSSATSKLQAVQLSSK